MKINKSVRWGKYIFNHVEYHFNSEPLSTVYDSVLLLTTPEKANMWAITQSGKIFTTTGNHCIATVEDAIHGLEGRLLQCTWAGKNFQTWSKKWLKRAISYQKGGN